MDEPSKNQYEFSLAKKNAKVFLEIIDVEDVIFEGTPEPSYPQLEECFRDERCRVNLL